MDFDMQNNLTLPVLPLRGLVVVDKIGRAYYGYK